jgi:hypothetical protein
MASKKQTAEQTTEQAAPIKAKIAAVKKITIAAVFGKVKIADIPKDGELPLVRIAGYADSTDSGESNFGPWECLSGNFAATNLATGEMFAGAKAFVPGAMGEQLCIAMRNALENDAEAKIRFSVDVSAKISPRDENKYEYIVRPVLEQETANPAVALLSMS